MITYHAYTYDFYRRVVIVATDEQGYSQQFTLAAKEAVDWTPDQLVEVCDNLAFWLEMGRREFERLVHDES